MKVYCVYILECGNNNYYTGYTSNSNKSFFLDHLNGSARCKFTRSFMPLRIAQWWEITEGKSLASKLEEKIRSLGNKQMQDLISNPTLIYAL